MNNNKTKNKFEKKEIEEEKNVAVKSNAFLIAYSQNRL